MAKSLPNFKITRNTGIRIGSTIAFLTLWETIGETTNPLLFATPLSTIRGLAELITSGRLASDLSITLSTLFTGFAMATTTGILLGIALGYYSSARVASEHYVNALNATPYIAFLPLIIVWLGIGWEARVAIVFLSAVLPIIINTMYGILYADQNLVETARAFGASNRQLIRKIILPGSLPFIMSGLRLGIGRAIVGVIVAEMFVQLAGLGGELLRFGDLFQTDKVIAIILVTACLGVGLTEVARTFERKFARWKPQTFR